MTKTAFKWRISAWLLASLCAWASVGKAGAEPGSAPAADPRLDMIEALKATGPHASLGDQAKVFGRLIGTWDVEYTDFKKDGNTTHRSGEFIVGWVMDGRAIQDFWIVYPSGARKEREVYTELRYYDPKSGAWPAIFIDPEHASVARFGGGAVGGDRIVLDTQDLDGMNLRWSFNDIRTDSLVYREEASSDGGKTWRLRSEYHMKRRLALKPSMDQGVAGE